MRGWSKASILAACALALGAAAAAPGRRPVSDARAERRFEGARELSEAGKLAEARAEVLAGLAYDPFATAGYRLAMDLAKLEGNVASQLHWGKWLYWAERSAGNSREAQAVATALDAAYEGWNRDEILLDDWQESVAKAARSADSKKHGRVAAYLWRKLLSVNPGDSSTRKQYVKVLEKYGAGILGEGFSAGAGHSADWIERQNEAHEEWKNAFERKTKHYKVITNVSYEFFETVCATMEEIYDYYEEFLDFRGKVPQLTLAIHRDQSEFQSYCADKLGYRVSGAFTFFVPEAMTVASCDWTGGENTTILLETLFERASQQILYVMTEKKTRQKAPAWLFFGTSAYFGGCQPKSDGGLLKNRPDPYYLGRWQQLEAENFDRSLEEVIKVSHDGYDRTYSPYAWSLVYFLNNYEDEDGNLVYRQPYLDYLASYRRKGAKDERERTNEAMERAQELFVDNVADPEVPDWAAFETRWREFTRQVGREHEAGLEIVDELHARCRQYLERRNFARAELIAERADEKQADHPETQRLLALANLGLERESDAVYWMLRHWESCLERQADDERAAAEAWLEENDGGYVVDGYCRTTVETISAVEGIMDAAISDGQPGVAMLFAGHALRAFGVDVTSLLLLVEDVRKDLASVDLRLWQRAFVNSSASNRKWRGTDVVTYDPDGVLVNNPKDMGRPQVSCWRPGLRRLVPPYDVRGTIVIDGENGAYLDLGAPSGGTRRLALRFQPSGTISAYTLGRSFDEDGRSSVSYKRVLFWAVPEGDRFEFELHVAAEGGGKLKVGDKTFDLPKPFTAELLTGRFAVAAGDGAVALFQKIEIRPGQPFWPVAPLGDDS